MLISPHVRARAIAPPQPPDTTLSAKQALAVLDTDDMTADYPSLLIPALEMLSRSDKHKGQMPLYCAKALDHYGWQLIDGGSYYLARELLRQGLRYCPKADSLTYYSIYSGLAFISLKQNNREEALRLLQRVAMFHRKSGQKAEYALDVYNTGVYYSLTDDYPCAMAVLDSALTLARGCEAPMVEALALNRMGEIGMDVARRAVWLRQAQEVALANNLKYLYASIALNMARLDIAQRDYVMALQHAKQSLDYANRMGPVDGRGKALRLMTDIYEAQRDWQMAYIRQNEAEQADRTGADVELAAFRENQRAQQLLDWCQTNVVLKADGKFELRRDRERQEGYLQAGIVALALLAVLVAIVFLYRRCRKAEMALNPDAAHEIYRQNGVIADMAREVSYLQLFYNNQAVLLRKIYDQLRQALGAPTMQNSATRELMLFIKENMLNEHFDSDFTVAQEQNKAAFLERLDRHHPGLSDGERQLALYLWLGLSTHEICVLTGNKARTINMGRYRLRKSLSLNQEQNLEAHLKGL